MPDEQVCRRCGHPRVAHLHHRSGTDCSLCDCPTFRPAGSPLARLLARIRPR